MHLFVAGVPSTDLGIMMHIVFPQLFSMNVEGNVRRSSFVKTCQFHHGKQNTTLFGLCIQYNSKHDFYILLYTLCTFIYFYAFSLQLFYLDSSFFLCTLPGMDHVEVTSWLSQRGTNLWQTLHLPQGLYALYALDNACWTSLKLRQPESWHWRGQDHLLQRPAECSMM